VEFGHFGDRSGARPPLVGNFVGNFVDLETAQHRDDSAQECSPVGGIRAGRRRLLLVKIRVSG
jgi:hypothetical protein